MAGVEEDATRRRLTAALPRSNPNSARGIIEAASKDTSPVTGLPGVSPDMLRKMLGDVAWGNLRTAEDTRQMGVDDERSSLTGAIHRVHAEVPRDLQLRGMSSAHLDAQRLLVRRSTAAGGSHGQDIINRVMIGVKRLPLNLQKETQGSLGSLLLKDGVTLPTLGFALEFDNPSIDTGNATSDGVRLARIRLLTPPDDMEAVQQQIQEINANHPDGATTVVGAWHSFDYWQPGDNSHNPYAVNFEDYNLSPTSPDGYTPGEIFHVAGSHAVIHAEVLDTTTEYGDPLMSIGISSLEHDQEAPPQIAFTVPGSLTFSGYR